MSGAILLLPVVPLWRRQYNFTVFFYPYLVFVVLQKEERKKNLPYFDFFLYFFSARLVVFSCVAQQYILLLIRNEWKINADNMEDLDSFLQFSTPLSVLIFFPKSSIMCDILYNLHYFYRENCKRKCVLSVRYARLAKQQFLQQRGCVNSGTACGWREGWAWSIMQHITTRWQHSYRRI